MRDRLSWFWEHINVMPDDCWQWEGARHEGYGMMTFDNGKRGYAHLWAHEHFIGPRPEGLVADHVCHQPPCAGGILCVHRRCCNPAHIEFVTNAENFARSARRWESSGLTCKHNHLWSENTRILSDGRKQCIACQNARSLRAYYKKNPPSYRI